ncbi:MAG TPA: DUF933 domain-containing protein, partial [Candidatus Goldiibacteriota bacterium]|nr:DUF933 domain-containing protein [Candidatus Goldiibacteriota bacterium]
VTKGYQKLERTAKSGDDKEITRKYEAFKKVKDALENGIPAGNAGLTPDEKFYVKELGLMSLKPVLYVLNVDEDKMENPEKNFPVLFEYLKKRNLEYVVISARIESEMMELGEEEKKEYLKELGFEYKGFDEFIRHSYRLLDLITFFTAGPKEVRAWPIKRGTKAEEAAGKIHSDIQRGFIKAEVMKFDDFRKVKDEIKMKESGLVRFEGRDYVMQDGDIVYFKFNV